MSRFLSEVKGFTPVIDILARELGLMTAVVYGIAWRYCQMEDRVCSASRERIAEHAGISTKTVERHLKKLCVAGYLEDLTPTWKHKPHIYADSGKAKIKGLLIAEVGQTESLTSEVGQTESPAGQTESLTRSDRESNQGKTESLIRIPSYDSTHESKEGEKDTLLSSNKKPQADPLMQDLERQTLAKRAEAGGNYATPAHAGGADRLADAALFALYAERGKRPPKKGTKQWQQQCSKVAEALKAYGYEKASLSLVEKAAGLLCERKGNWTNVFHSSFPMDFGQALSDAEGAAAQRTAPHHQPESALLSQEALRERQAAQPPPPQDDAVGKQVKTLLEPQMSRHTFMLYIQPSRFACENGVLTITTLDDFTRDWLENRLGAIIKRALAGVADGPGEVRFEIAPQKITEEGER